MFAGLLTGSASPDKLGDDRRFDGRDQMSQSKSSLFKLSTADSIRRMTETRLEVAADICHRPRLAGVDAVAPALLADGPEVLVDGAVRLPVAAGFQPGLFLRTGNFNFSLLATGAVPVHALRGAVEHRQLHWPAASACGACWPRSAPCSSSACAGVGGMVLRLHFLTALSGFFDYFLADSVVANRAERCRSGSAYSSLR